MIRTQVQLTPEQWKQLKERSHRTGLSMSAEIRAAVDKHLLEASEPVKSAAEILTEIAGFRSGLHDVAERHDHYLTRAFED